MDKYRIISAVSIEFGLSKEQSETIVSNIFFSISQFLKKNKTLEIQKFGKFKLIPEKNSDEFRAKFSPSKKLSLRVNSNFEDLKKVKLKSELKLLKEDNSVYKLSETFQKKDLSIPEESSIDIKTDEDEIVITEVKRKLISDDLIKLHKEIIKEDKDESSETNLWG